MKLDITIEPIISDNTAFTVLTALRSLGYEQLERVERADQLFLALDDGSPAHAIAEKIARAEILFNPNKHRLRYAEDAAGRDDALGFEVLVRDSDEDNTRLAKALVSTFGISGLRGLERAVAWRLDERGGCASPERLEWACRALLANAVSQTYRIRPRPAYRSLAAAAR
jgi:phosphoribosylformylglycinamidine (FGAM) synthase PurS component